MSLIRPVMRMAPSRVEPPEVTGVQEAVGGERVGVE